MATQVLTTLKFLECSNSKSGHSRPYIWSALLFFDVHGVGIARPGPEAVQVVLKEDMRPGDTADIPTSVGILSAQIDGGFAGMALVVLLFQKEETRVHSMRDGFEAFFSELVPAVTANLGDLISRDDATRNAAIERIKARVQAKIEKAIYDHLDTGDKLFRTLDSLIGSGFQFLDLRSQFFNVGISAAPGEYTVRGVLDTGSWAARPVVSWAPNRLDIFGLGVDNDMFHNWWDRGPRWGGWERLGGTFNSPPAAVSWAPNRLDIFGLGVDNDMFHKWWDGTNWGPSRTDWEWLGGTFNSPPAAVSWAPNRLDIFGVGVDNTMFHKWWDPTWTAPDGSHWGPSQTDWQPLALGGDTVIFNSPPAAVSWGPNRLDIFGVGVGGIDSRQITMFHTWWDGTNWGPPNSNTLWEWLGGTFNSPPAAVSWGPNRLDIFGVGVGGIDSRQITMFHKWWDGTNWGPSRTDWEWLGGTFNSPPAAVSWGPNRLDIFGVGVDNTMFHKWWDGTNWGPSRTDWVSLGDTQFISPPAAVSWAPNRLDIFGLDVDNVVRHNWSGDGTNWGGWEPLGDNINRLNRL